MSFVTAVMEYLREAIEEEHQRSLAARYSGMVVECRPFAWRLALHLRSTADVQDDADYSSWDLSHVPIPEEQPFLDAPAEALGRAIDRGEGDWTALYERIVVEVSRAVLALEAEGFFARAPFASGVVYYVVTEEELRAEDAMRRLDAIRGGALEPGWSLAFLR